MVMGSAGNVDFEMLTSVLESFRSHANMSTEAEAVEFLREVGSQAKLKNSEYSFMQDLEAATGRLEGQVLEAVKADLKSKLQGQFKRDVLTETLGACKCHPACVVNLLKALSSDECWKDWHEEQLDKDKLPSLAASVNCLVSFDIATSHPLLRYFSHKIDVTKA